MSGQILSSGVRAELLLRHKRERDGRIKDRIKAVLLRDDGWTYVAIAKALFLTDEGARLQVEDYLREAKLAPENGGSSSHLDAAQTADLEAHLEQHLYVKADQIAAHVLETYGVSYSTSGMTDWLARNGFTFHQPCGVPAKADAHEQQTFVNHYETLVRTLSEDDHILFIDGVHPSHAVRFMRGWIRKGVRKEIPTNGSQRRLNILGALNLETMTVHTQEYNTLNADAIIAFFVSLLAGLPRGVIHIVLDRGRYQHCAAIWEWVAQNPRIRLHYLPTYSPNINAIEPSWKIMHEHTTNNHYHATFKQFTESIRHFFDVTFPQKAHEWTDRLTDNFRIIGSPLRANS